MQLIIHDLDEKQTELLSIQESDNVKIISNNGNIKNCRGCFGCWVKTPGECIIKNDEYGNIGKLFGQTDELTIISECIYGAYSPFVKNVMDRCIGYLLPFFKIENGEMHHRMRYDNQLKVNILLYGENLSEEEKEIATEISTGNFINMSSEAGKILFFNKISELKGALS